MIRIHIGPGSHQPGETLSLPEAAARHVQVLRAQPGDRIECFDGLGKGWWAEVLTMARREVLVRVVAEAPALANELPQAIGLAVGMPANDRMDALIEKAVELGAAFVQPLVCERNVLRLSGDRADRKVSHWQAVAASAAEQCGRRVLPLVAPVRPLGAWLAEVATLSRRADHVLLSLGESLSSASRSRLQAATGGEASRALAPSAVMPGAAARWVLSGPEGGLAPHEELAATSRGFVPTRLGPRVLRADTAPLAWLAHHMMGIEGDAAGAAAKCR